MTVQKVDVTFLFSNKKVTKEIDSGVAFYKDAPLENPPPAGKKSFFTSSRQKCADFCPPVRMRELGRAGRAAAPAIVTIQSFVILDR